MNTEFIIILVVTVALFGLPFWAWLFERLKGSRDQRPPANEERSPEPREPSAGSDDKDKRN